MAIIGHLRCVRDPFFIFFNSIGVVVVTAWVAMENRLMIMTTGTWTTVVMDRKMVWDRIAAIITPDRMGVRKTSVIFPQVISLVTNQVVRKARTSTQDSSKMMKSASTKQMMRTGGIRSHLDLGKRFISIRIQMEMRG